MSRSIYQMEEPIKTQRVTYNTPKIQFFNHFVHAEQVAKIAISKSVQLYGPNLGQLCHICVYALLYLSIYSYLVTSAVTLISAFTLTSTVTLISAVTLTSTVTLISAVTITSTVTHFSCHLLQLSASIFVYKQ